MFLRSCLGYVGFWVSWLRVQAFRADLKLTVEHLNPGTLGLGFGAEQEGETRLARRAKRVKVILQNLPTRTLTHIPRTLFNDENYVN